MDKAYYAITNVGPYKERQVVVLDDADGWTRTGYLRELIDPWAGPEVSDGDTRQDRPE
jgi:hypothetical protein